MHGKPVERLTQQNVDALKSCEHQGEIVICIQCWLRVINRGKSTIVGPPIT